MDELIEIPKNLLLIANLVCFLIGVTFGTLITASLWLHSIATAFKGVTK